MGSTERRQREKEARRRTILDAARKLFEKSSFHSTTMDEIAEQAELSKGAVYYYFPSKQEILGALLLENLQMALNVFTTAVDGVEGPENKLHAIGGAFLQFIVTQIHASKTSFLLKGDFNSAEMSDEMREQLAETIRKIFDFIEEIAQEGIAAGVFRDELDPKKMVLVIWGAAIGIHALNARLTPFVIPDFAEEVYAEILKWLPRTIIK